MGDLRIFETMEHGRVDDKDGKPLFVLSAICDDDGSFKIAVDGTGGMDSAEKAVEWLKEIVSTPYEGE